MINRPTPPELYQSYLAEPDKGNIEGFLASDRLREAADETEGVPRRSVHLHYTPEKRIITVTTTDSDLANRVADTIVEHFGQSDQKRRKALEHLLDDIEIAQADKMSDARREFSSFVRPKMCVDPPVERVGINKMIFDQTADLLMLEIERERDILTQLRASHQRLRLLLKISFEPATVIKRAR